MGFNGFSGLDLMDLVDWIQWIYGVYKVVIRMVLNLSQTHLRRLQMKTCIFMNKWNMHGKNKVKVSFLVVFAFYVNMIDR